MANVDTIVYKLRNRIHQNCLYIFGWCQGEFKKRKSPPPVFLWKMKSFSISILEVWHSFLKDPIQHIRGALGVPCCPCVGLECFYLQFISLIQIRARLNLNSVNVLQQLWLNASALPWNRTRVLCSYTCSQKTPVDNVRIPE